MPESGVQKVTRYVLHTSVVVVDRHPVLELVRICEGMIVVWITETEEVPGGTSPLRHGIGLTLRRTTALRAGAVHETVDLRQRGLSIGTRLEVLDIWEGQRKLLLRNDHGTTVRAVNERNRLTPVALTVERPVLHLILYTLVTDATLGEDLEHLVDGILLVGEAIEEAGVHHLTVAGVGLLRDIATLDDLDDLNTELLCEVVVTLIVCRYGHDRAGAVAHHDIVGDEDRDLLTGDRVDRRQTLDAYTSLLLHELCTLELRLLRCLVTVVHDGVPVRNLILVLIERRMLRSDDHEGDAIEGITTGGIDLELVIDGLSCLISELEVHERTGAAADPGHLLLLDGLRIIDIIESLQETVRVLCDAEIPYILRKLYDIAVADVALAALGILVRKNDLAVRAVVDEGLRTEYEIMLIELLKDPLGPLVVILMRGRDLTAPVEGEADLLHLILEVLDVLLRDDMRVGVGLDGIVLCRQSEGVEAHREEDVVALHSALT